MEEKQLDFNAPLLSVRRFSSKAEKTKKIENFHGSKPYLPPYKSELKSGPIRDPGAVPFTWEQIPGRPKDEDGSKLRSLERPPITPKLPPGRNLKVKQQSSVESEGKTLRRSQNDYFLDTPAKKSSSQGIATTLESSKKGIKENQDSDSNSDSEDGDNAYADAMDTLSRTESFFYNCSVSGVSGLDGPDAKPSGVFLSDPQTRDFMMGRFLPAAKAMASETPQYAPRRQPVTQEQPSQVKKVLNVDRRSTVYQYRPNSVAYVHDTVDEESEDEDDEYSDTGNFSTKVCGLLPRFCLKNSLCLLNPVPGIKVRSQAPLPPVRKVTQIKTAYGRSDTVTNDESNWEAVYKHKLSTSLQKLEDERKLIGESNQLTCWSDSQTPDGSSPNMGSGGGGISPYKNEAPQSPFHEGRRFLGIPKQVKNFKSDVSDSYKNDNVGIQGTVSHLNSKQGSHPISPTVEKTLYVDSEHAKIGNSNFTSVNATELMESSVLTASQGKEDTPVSVSSLQDIKDFVLLKEKGALKPAEFVSISSQSSLDRSNPKGYNMEGLRKGSGLDHESRSIMRPTRGAENLAFHESLVSNADDHGTYSLISLQSPLPPPLPKSPSESWLWRTLPSISSRNDAQFHPRKQHIKTPSVDPKWETIVKTSNVHHGHLRFSEELNTSLSQQSGT